MTVLADAASIDDIDPFPEWRTWAACRGVDPDLFFPDRGQPVGPALAVCNRCPVRVACLRENLDERHGIFGGTTERARRLIRKKRAQVGLAPTPVRRPPVSVPLTTGISSRDAPTRPGWTSMASATTRKRREVSAR